MTTKKKEGNTSPYLDEQIKFSSNIAASQQMIRICVTVMFISLFIVVVVIASWVYLARQPSVQPYIVEVSALKEARWGGAMPAVPVNDQRVAQKATMDWIQALSVVSVDANLQGDFIRYVYSMLKPDEPARVKVDAFYTNSASNPFELAKDFLISVSVESVIPLTPYSSEAGKVSTWQVDWVQNVINREGKPISSQKYRATVHIYLDAPPQGQNIRFNPIGFYIRDYSIVRVND